MNPKPFFRFTASAVVLLLSCLFSSGSLNAQDSTGGSRQRTYYAIASLLPNGKDVRYGFVSASPVKVGRSETGGGAANERAYLELLRDATGMPVQYKRTGSCCAYKSENGFLGNALLSMYEIVFRDAQGKERRKTVYISHYDYEPPKVLAGFTAQ